MNKTLLIAIGTFAAGAAAGVVGGMYYSKAKYVKMITEEAEKSREYYANLYGPREKTEVKVNVNNDIPQAEKKAEIFDDYSGVIEKLDYSKIGKNDADDIAKANEVKAETKKKLKFPFIVTADEYGDKPGYDAKSYTYYAKNDILVDENEIPLEYRDAIVGNLLSTFDEENFEDDVIYVRNPAEKCDYEILKVDDVYDYVEEN